MPKRERADRDPLDRPLDRANVDVFAAAERVVEQEEHAGDDIAHEGLGAEPQRQTDDAGTGEQRPDVDVHGRQHRDGGDREHGRLQRQPQGRQQGRQARGTLAGIVAHGLHTRILGLQLAIDRKPGQLPDHVGQQQDDRDLQRRLAHLLLRQATGPQADQHGRKHHHEADLGQAGCHRGGVRAGRSPDALEQRQNMRQAHHDGERGRAGGERQPAVEQTDQRECEPDREHGQGTDIGPGASQRPQAAALGADAEEIGGDVGAGQQGCRTKHEAGAGTGRQQHQLMDRAIPGADHGQEAAGEEAE